jgi:hypothetical protein
LALGAWIGVLMTLGLEDLVEGGAELRLAIVN